MNEEQKHEDHAGLSWEGPEPKAVKFSEIWPFLVLLASICVGVFLVVLFGLLWEAGV